MSAVIPVPCGDNYAYICPTVPGRCLVVDPGDGDTVSAALIDLRLVPDGAFLTHGHGDHTAGVPGLLRKYPEMSVHAAPSLGYVPVREGDSLPGLESRVMETPGHSKDSLCLLTEYGLFTGDTLFGAGCGRVFTGDYTSMYASLSRIASLPPETALFFGHEYTPDNLEFALTVEPENGALHRYRSEVTASGCSVPGVISREMETNPFLRTGQEGVIRFAREKGAASGDPLSVFITLRQEKDRF